MSNLITRVELVAQLTHLARSLGKLEVACSSKPGGDDVHAGSHLATSVHNIRSALECLAVPPTHGVS